MPVEKLTNKAQFSFTERQAEFPFSPVKFVVCLTTQYNSGTVKTKLNKRKSPHHQPLLYRYTVSVSFSVFYLLTEFLSTGFI